MDKAMIILFWCAVFLIFHTYLLYPFWMILFYSKRKIERMAFHSNENLPSIAILVAAFNEEKVIADKIHSIFNTTYPIQKLKVLIGSDASNDKTESIVNALTKKYSQLKLIKFEGRVGKINIVNALQSHSEEEILIMSDANVIFTPTTIFELVKFFKDAQVGIVAANIKKQSIHNEGISLQEKFYLTLENKVKASESNAFDLIMGAEGGCYAIRNNLFSKVPSKFNVDDFYITFQVLLKNKKVLFNPDAVCFEDVSGAIEGEYKRKVRISSGNFQNLLFFRNVLYQFYTTFGFAFLSHKVLRWFTPFFLIISIIASGLLIKHDLFFMMVFALQMTLMIIAFFNYFLKINSSILKFITHFYFMNLALLHGFVKFSKGIQSSIWEPVERNV